MKPNFCQQVVKGWLPRLQHIGELTAKTGNEHGFFLYPKQLHGKTCKGGSEELPTMKLMYKGCRPFGSVHTHPTRRNEHVRFQHLPSGGAINRQNKQTVDGDVSSEIEDRLKFGCTLSVSYRGTVNTLFCYPATRKFLKVANEAEKWIPIIGYVEKSSWLDGIERKMLRLGACKLDISKLK